MCTRWEKSIFSLHGVGEEAGYIGQEGLKFFSSHSMGKGRMIRLFFFFFLFLLSKTPLAHFVLLSLGHHKRGMRICHNLHKKK